MWKNLCGLLFVISLASHADEDLFTDGQVEIEFDKDFEDDDWVNIESSPNADTKTLGLVIADSFTPFSDRDLLRKEKSLSFLGGNETIASTYHFLLYPQARFQVMQLFGHLGVPLRFPVYDNLSSGSGGLRSRGFVAGKTFITPRKQDFRNFFDAQRVVRHLEVGDEHGSYFFRASRTHSASMGQGELMRGMSPDGFYDQDNLFLFGQTNFNNVRVNGFVGPMVKAKMLALSARFTPLVKVNAPAFVRNMNFELAYISDFMAPNQMKEKDGAYILDDERRHIARATGTAQGASLGVLSEYFALPWLSLKPYTSMGNLWLTGLPRENGSSVYGAGWHLGHDATVYFLPGTTRSMLVLKTEGRLFSKRYWPGYFGSTYLIDRVVLNEPSNKSLGEKPLTKSQYLSEQSDPNLRVGYLFELAYAYENILSALIGYENAHSFRGGQQIDPMRKLQFVLSFLGLDPVKFHLGYEATSIAQMKELFDFEKSRALLSLRGQLKLTKYLYFDAWGKHSFGINDMFTSTGQEDGNAVWLSHQAETRSLNFGVGLEFAMTF